MRPDINFSKNNKLAVTRLSANELRADLFVTDELIVRRMISF